VCYYFGHLNIVYFAGPGQVEDLSLHASSQSITVLWKKPISNSDCITNYIIEWVNAVSGNKETVSVAREVEFFILEYLDACVEYEVSVTAVNADGVGDNTVTGTAKINSAGNYHKHIVCYVYNVVAHK
jgi:hypothetical protein